MSTATFREIPAPGAVHRGRRAFSVVALCTLAATALAAFLIRAASHAPG